MNRLFWSALPVLRWRVGMGGVAQELRIGVGELK